MVIRAVFVCLAAVVPALPAFAATVSGAVSDVFGGLLPGTQVIVREVATGREYSTETDTTGRFTLNVPAGTYLVVVTRPAFSEAARTVVIGVEQETVDVPIQLELGARITPTLLTSPFRIAQDLLSLDGFTVQRIGWGVNFPRGRERFGVTFAGENLANVYYREYFQFAPARGRSFTVGLSAGAFQRNNSRERGEATWLMSHCWLDGSCLAGCSSSTG